MINQNSNYNDLKISHMSNKLSTYHQVIRDNFNFGDNRRYLNYDVDWLFDIKAKPLYKMGEEQKDEWFSTDNFSSVFVASEGIDPLKSDKYIQRTGVCLIESAEIRKLTNMNNSGAYLTEKDAIEIISMYPSESQLIGVKPILDSEVVIYLEDVLFEELWDKFTGGSYSKSKSIQEAFQEQIVRTEEAVRGYAKLMHPSDTPNMRFIKFSDIWKPLKKGTKDWIEQIKDSSPYQSDENFYIPNAALVLFTYMGPNLLEVSNLPQDKELVIVKQLSHCVIEKGWTRNKSQVMGWFSGSLIEYCKLHPRAMIGYVDLFNNQANCTYYDTPIENKVCRGHPNIEVLQEAVEHPFPLWNNLVFQRGITRDFDDEIFNKMINLGLINSAYVYNRRPKESKSKVKQQLIRGLKDIYEDYLGTIIPLLTNQVVR